MRKALFTHSTLHEETEAQQAYGMPQTGTQPGNAVQFSRSVMSDSLRPHGLQHSRPPYPAPTTGVYANSGPLSQ